jgi:hypothetical protein
VDQVAGVKLVRDREMRQQRHAVTHGNKALDGFEVEYGSAGRFR